MEAYYSELITGVGTAFVGFLVYRAKIFEARKNNAADMITKGIEMYDTINQNIMAEAKELRQAINEKDLEIARLKDEIRDLKNGNR